MSTQEDVGRATFLPGWKWSEHVKPIAVTDSCQAAHMGYVVSGRMKVVGDEPCVFVDWRGFADYAKR